MKSFWKRSFFAVIAVVAGAFAALVVTEYVRDGFITRTLEPAAGIEWYGQITDALLASLLLVSVALGALIYQALAFREEVAAQTRRDLKDVIMAGSQFKALYELSPVPYFLITPAGAIEQPNKAMLRICKGTAMDISGKSFHELLAGGSRETFADLHVKFRHDVAIADVELRIRQLNGAERDTLFSLFHIESGTKKGWGLGTLVDITERKEIERAKTEFVSLAAHQLRSPISTIKWYSELLVAPEAGALTEKQARYVEHIHTGTKNMNDLVHTLLNVSRLEMGTLPIAYAETDIAALCDDVIEEVRVEAESKQIQFTREYKGPRSFVTDPKLLRIVIQNLISNAVKYTPQNGTVTVRIGSSGRDMTLEVIDTGYGIPPEAQDKIFTKLFRAENAVQKVPSGNGLGLYMSKAILETLRGAISFTSTLGKGTTFTITLPKGKV